jgi:RNA polymerase sigma-70 factor (ECF subfamily)
MMGVMAEELQVDVHLGVSLRDFGAWMAAEQKRIFLLCRRMLQDPDEADSATQDAFLKAYRALSKNDAETEDLEYPSRWITRIAMNTCLDRLRSRRWKIWRQRPPAEDEARILEFSAGNEPDAESQVFARQIQVRIEAALNRLSDRQRAVFALRHYEAMPIEEIAEVLKLEEGTVKAHLFRAIAKLREELKDLYLPRGERIRREA